MNLIDFSQTSVHGYRAKTIIPVPGKTENLDDGLIFLKNNKIIEVGKYNQVKRHYSSPITDLGSVTVIPGLINSHTHLELSHLQGQTIQGQGFEKWVKSLIRLPLKRVDSVSLQKARQEIISSGTIALGDVSGHNPQKMISFLQDSGLYYRLFLEFIGFKKISSDKIQWPKGLSANKYPQISLSGHALYSTHPRTLQQTKSWTSQNQQPYVIHLAEHPGEVELLTTGRGKFAKMLKSSLLPKNFVPPEMSPVAYADSLGLLDQNTLAIHCVQVSLKDIKILKKRQTTVCLCPRSNQYIGVDRAPWEDMLKAGIPLCLGTDSLASNFDLNLWAEVRHLLKDKKTEVPLSLIVSFLTLNPARALGLDHFLGSLEKGKIGKFTLVPEDILEYCS